MEGVDALAIGTLLIRTGNLVLWVYVCGRILQHDAGVPRLVRRLICSVIVFGMAVLAFGALTQFGLFIDVARPLYTAFTAFSAIVALAIATTDILDPAD